MMAFPFGCTNCWDLLVYAKAQHYNPRIDPFFHFCNHCTSAEREFPLIPDAGFRYHD